MKTVLFNDQEKYKDDVITEFMSFLDRVSDSFPDEGIADEALMNFWDSSYVNLTFATEEQIQKINAETREIDKVTDVLSFPMLDMHNGKLNHELSQDDFEIDEDGEKTICLGDVIICLEKAYQQSLEYGHSFEREVSFLFAHSMLHLVGFDHLEPDDERLMIFWQRKLMADIGLASDEEIEFVSHADEKKVQLRKPAAPAGSIAEHVGYVAIIGRPNVGKSTLLNYISGMKLAIVSHKPQTTRTNIKSIYNTENSQIIFVDTPGVHKPGSKLSEIMVQNSFKSARHADVVLLLADGRFKEPGNVEKQLIGLCKENNKRVILAVNKADDVSKESLLPIILSYSKLYNFDEIVPISARTGDNVDTLLKLLTDRLPEGPRLFDSEEMTDETEREIACELIREQVLHYTDQEIPHGTTVEITSFEEKMKSDAKDDYDRDIVVIHANIICERKSHRAIILGKDGQMIKRIGTKARTSIERLTGCKVYLDLFVKVREDWQNDDLSLKQFGYVLEDDD